MGNVRGAAVAVFAVGGILLLSFLIGKDESAPNTAPEPSSSLTSSMALSSVTPTEEPPGPAARSAVGAPVEVPGATAPSAPTIDFTDPLVVVKAYIETAHTLRPEESGRTNRRVLPFLTQDNPDYPRGIVVEAVSQTVVATVQVMELVSGDEAGSARAYRVAWKAGEQVAEGYVVLRRQDDGRWLVRQETARLQPGDR